MNRLPELGKEDKSAALLVVDVQLGMFESALIPPVYGAENLLNSISSLITRARSMDVPIIYVQHGGRKGDPIEEGTPASQIHPAIKPIGDDIVVHKRFCDSFYQTDLQAILDSSSIKKLVIAGIQTEFCVDTACRRAFSLGYEVTLVEDGHSTWDNKYLRAEQIIKHHNLTLGSSFVKLAKCGSLFNGSTFKARSQS